MEVPLLSFPLLERQNILGYFFHCLLVVPELNWHFIVTVSLLKNMFTSKYRIQIYFPNRSRSQWCENDLSWNPTILSNKVLKIASPFFSGSRPYFFNATQGLFAIGGHQEPGLNGYVGPVNLHRDLNIKVKDLARNTESTRNMLDALDLHERTVDCDWLKPRVCRLVLGHNTNNDKYCSGRYWNTTEQLRLKPKGWVTLLELRHSEKWGKLTSPHSVAAVGEKFLRGKFYNSGGEM